MKTKQPAALKFLFLTELWERFAYFAVMSILVLFMTQQFHDNDQMAYLIFGAYGAMLFITPVIGGWLADRILGYPHAIILGAILLAAGYGLLSLGSHQTFLIALAILIIGNGFFKPNISTLLGTFYNKDDKRRDAGFTWFYIGINIGGTLGVILCGVIAKWLGWDLAFLIAGCGMIVGLIIFLIGTKRLGLKNQNPPAKAKTIMAIYSSIIVAIALLIALLHSPSITNLCLDGCGLLLIGLLIAIALRSTKIERHRLLICAILIVFSIAFWALYQQTPMTLTLFTKRAVSRSIFGITIPTSVFWALNGIFLVLLAPLLIKFWSRLNKIGKEPSVTVKFVLGIILMATGYIILYGAANSVNNSNLASIWWIIASYAIQTLGELCLSPIGLAMVTALAPEKYRGLLMGIWFFSLAAATAIASQLAKVASIAPTATSRAAIAHTYAHAFGEYGIAAFVVGLMLLALVPALRKLKVA